ncbi:MAG: hypothetical protein WCZ66_09770 [Sphingomonadaceae bacterium]
MPAPVTARDAALLPRLAVLVFAVLQALTPLLPRLGIGQPIGERSDNVQTLITPAGWAFSIWGPLYAGSIIFAIFQALPSQRRSALLGRIRWPAAGAFLGNALWAAYAQLFGLGFISVLIILFTLVCLLIVYRDFSRWPPDFTRQERWLVLLPLSALAAWLTAATIANVAATLRFHGVEAGDAAPAIAAAVLIAGGSIAAAALYRSRGNPAYALVFLWALAGIYMAGGQVQMLVGVSAGVAAALVIGGMVAGLRRKNQVDGQNDHSAERHRGH